MEANKPFLTELIPAWDTPRVKYLAVIQYTSDNKQEFEFIDGAVKDGVFDANRFGLAKIDQISNWFISVPQPPDKRNVEWYYDKYVTYPTYATVACTYSDPVNHPSHYAQSGYPFECIEAMEKLFGYEACRHFCLLNAFKYRFRAGNKSLVENQVLEDLKKEKWYLDRSAYYSYVIECERTAMSVPSYEEYKQLKETK